MNRGSNNYHGEYFAGDNKKWAAVQEQFSMTEEEPDYVYWAEYSYADYSGSADVIYRRGPDYYVVNGSHCSCNGLEGQWTPEKYTGRDLFLSIVAKWGNSGLREAVLKAFAEEWEAQQGQTVAVGTGRRRRMVSTDED